MGRAAIGSYDWWEIDQTSFWRKVQIGDDDECWPWLGKKREGYGMYPLVTDKGRQDAAAYIISWELTHEETFPAGMVGRHRCDTNICVNPYHIIPGTIRENRIDQVVRGNHAKGDSSGARKHPENMGYVGKRAEYYFEKYGRTEPTPKAVARRGTYKPKLRQRGMVEAHRDGEAAAPKAEILEEYQRADAESPLGA